MSDPFINAMKFIASDLEGVMAHLCKKDFLLSVLNGKAVILL